jgi:hypothetical protein
MFVVALVVELVIGTLIEGNDRRDLRVVHIEEIQIGRVLIGMNDHLVVASVEERYDRVTIGTPVNVISVPGQKGNNLSVRCAKVNAPTDERRFGSTLWRRVNHPQDCSTDPVEEDVWGGGYFVDEISKKRLAGWRGGLSV